MEAPLTPPKCPQLQITGEMIKKALSALSNKAAPGPDGVVTGCYKQGGPLILAACLDIFSSSLSEGALPQGLRDAFITPIWKGGDRTRPANYRPVALTTHQSKLLERIVRAHLVGYLEATGAMDSSQHGARGGRSTLSQLLVQHDLVLKISRCWSQGTTLTWYI